MSKVVSISANQERLESASRWIVRLDKGLSDAEQAELQAWMSAHPKNAERLLSMAERWDKMQDLARLAELFPEAKVNTAPRSSMPRWAMAATTVLVIVTATLMWLPKFGGYGVGETPSITEERANTYETAIGGHSTVTLSDGTIVVLNTNSLIRVAYSARARVLFLERGEIHVDVAEDINRPLSVMAANRIVQAVGTSFSVEITDSQQIELVVTEGKVVVGIREPSNEPAKAPPPRLAQSSSNTVAAGQETLLGAPDEAIEAVSADDIEVRLSWRKGRLIFRGEPLEAALAEVERYTTVQFVFVDDNIRTREVTGRFRAGDVDGLLLALRMNFNISHERADDGRVLLSSL